MKKKGRKMETENETNPAQDTDGPGLFDGEVFAKALKQQIKAAGGTKALYAKGDVVQGMVRSLFQTLLEAEMDEHLGYEKSEQGPKPTTNRRNGKTNKTVRGDFGEVELSTPRDRDGTFDPIVVEKGETSLGKFADKVISLYTRGMTTREIEAHLHEMYGIDASPQFVSRCVERIQEQVTDWQNRPLEALYPVIYVDGLFVSVRSGENKGPVVKKCIYVVLGISVTGKQDVLGLWIQETEGARFWLKVFNDLLARGLKDVLILCGDGLNGLPEAATSVFPQVDVQLCVVHQIRNATRFVSFKDRKPFCADMKPIYHSPTIEAAELACSRFQEKWGKQYPASVDSWRRNWDKFTAFYKYPPELRRIVYTTNSIESLNAQLRKNTANRKVFPTDSSVITLLYLNIRNLTAKWTKRQNWGTIMNQLSIIFPERLAEVLQNLEGID